MKRYFRHYLITIHVIFAYKIIICSLIVYIQNWCTFQRFFANRISALVFSNVSVPIEGDG